MSAMIHQCTYWHDSREETEAVMIKRRAPLSAGRMNGVEDQIGVLLGAIVAW